MAMIDKLGVNTIRWTLVLTVITALLLIIFKETRWSMGFLTAAIWSMLNFFLTLNLMEVATLRKSKSNLLVMLIIKFPILYLAGFLILVSKIFPLASILVGLLPILLVMGTLALCTKRI